MKSNKNTARIVGIFFLAAIVAYGIGNGLIASVLTTQDYLSAISVNKLQLVVGALLMLVNSALIVGIGVMMLPILKQHNNTIAYWYFSSRIIESILLIVGVISLLSLLTISQEYVKAGIPDASYFKTLSTLAIKGNYFAYQIAMIVLGLGSVAFCYLLYQSQLLPRFIAAWGLIGYAIFLTGSVLEILGFNIGLILSIPGGLFELFLSVWLIVNGFNSAIHDSIIQKLNNL